jgi:L-lactate dehydrogenase complex protein LldG
VVTDVAAVYAEAARANECTVHGPYVTADAVRAVAGVAGARSDGQPIAVAAADPALRGLDVAGELRARGHDVIRPGDDDWDDRLRIATVGVTGAQLAVAEQGVMALACTAAVPRATSLLPATHVCVVFVDTVLATFAAAIEHVAAEPLPSALTWIGGPSRTGDLEMVQTLGVHGPKLVEIVLVHP